MLDDVLMAPAAAALCNEWLLSLPYLPVHSAPWLPQLAQHLKRTHALKTWECRMLWW